MMSIGRVVKLTKAKYLLRDRKGSGYLIVFNIAMSFGNSRDYSRASTR